MCFHLAKCSWIFGHDFYDFEDNVGEIAMFLRYFEKKDEHMHRIIGQAGRQDDGPLDLRLGRQ